MYIRGLLLIWSLFRKSLIFSNMSFKRNWSFSESFLRKWKQEDSRYIHFIEKLITNIAEQFGDFSFRKQLMQFPQILFSDRHCRMLNWSKTHALWTCVDQRCIGNFMVPKFWGAFSLIYVGNNSSLTDESVWA